MRDRPGGAELLLLARKVLREDLLKLIPDARRYDALMAANAMAIAARELELGDGPVRQELAELRAFYGESTSIPSDRGDVERELHRLSARLAADIRDGAFDVAGERRSAVRAVLLNSVRRKLQASNPRALEAAGLE